MPVVAHAGTMQLADGGAGRSGGGPRILGGVGVAMQRPQGQRSKQEFLYSSVDGRLLAEAQN